MSSLSASMVTAGLSSSLQMPLRRSARKSTALYALTLSTDSCSMSLVKRAVFIRLASTRVWAVWIRSSTPDGSMRRRMSVRIRNAGVAKAFSLRNFTAAACRSRETGVKITPACPPAFCCES